VVQPRRHVGDIQERSELGADSVPTTFGMSAEIAEPARVRWNPDRHHTIIGSKRVTAERAYRFLVDE